jgi:tripartite-type tricarboxylate transporter receptor subunit TctC
MSVIRRNARDERERCRAGAAFPNRPIKIIVYVTPGALVDTTTRAVAERMAEN